MSDCSTTNPNETNLPPSPSPPQHAPPLKGFAKKLYKAHYELGKDTDQGSKEILPARQVGKDHLFFYGTLMDPTTLSNVLDLKERPELQQARLIGYHYKMWGPYPALLRGPPESVVEGFMFKLQSLPLIKRLEDYETESFRLGVCHIILADGSRVPGSTFLWRGDLKELREGVFDLKDYQMEQLEENLEKESLN